MNLRPEIVEGVHVIRFSLETTKLMQVGDEICLLVIPSGFEGVVVEQPMAESGDTIFKLLVTKIP